MRELGSLLEGGELRLVYVLGVPRANTTVLCRLIGKRLHGAVYEPALPNTARPGAAYPVKILAAYRKVRAQLPGDEPVVLAVKDMSALMRPAERDFALAHASHLVFAIREPVAQHESYARQMLAEFAALNRLSAFLTAPWETTMYGLYFGRRLLAYRRLARQRLGLGWSTFRRATAAGANLEFWDPLSAHFDDAVRRVPAERISVMDAGLSRLAPQAAEAVLDAIAAPHAPARRVEQPVDFAGHTMMTRRSRWAGEAMRAERLLPAESPGRVESPYADFEVFLRRFAGQVYPAYLRLFFHPAHRLRRDFAATQPERRASDALVHDLLRASGPDAALALVRARGRIAA